jgi:hypothetical protein
MPARIVVKPMLAVHKEALVSLIGLNFVEEHGLLARELLADARASLSALFLRTSGEETLLRRLIETLETTRRIHHAFSNIARTLSDAYKSAEALDGKVAALREQLAQMQPSAEENTDFIGPFLSFAQMFQSRIDELAGALNEYLRLKETEARCNAEYRAAKQARGRLRQRLVSHLASETRGEVESRIKQEIIHAFDFTTAETNMRHARRESRAAETRINGLLDELHAMRQRVMNPAMREKRSATTPLFVPSPYPDVFGLFAAALPRHPRLAMLKEPVLELFRLYQHAHGMFQMDFQRLGSEIMAVFDNPATYFEAKEQDLDIRRNQEKLRKIEGLIAFLERGAELIEEKKGMGTYHRFSRRVTEVLEDMRAPWTHIAQELLRAKIQAEAELSTRL